MPARSLSHMDADFTFMSSGCPPIRLSTLDPSYNWRIPFCDFHLCPRQLPNLFDLCTSATNYRANKLNQKRACQPKMKSKWREQMGMDMVQDVVAWCTRVWCGDDKAGFDLVRGVVSAKKMW